MANREENDLLMLFSGSSAHELIGSTQAAIAQFANDRSDMVLKTFPGPLTVHMQVILHSGFFLNYKSGNI